MPTKRTLKLQKTPVKLCESFYEKKIVMPLKCLVLKPCNTHKRARVEQLGPIQNSSFAPEKDFCKHCSNLSLLSNIPDVPIFP